MRYEDAVLRQRICISYIYMVLVWSTSIGLDPDWTLDIGKVDSLVYTISHDTVDSVDSCCSAIQINRN
jgi:hypothetical protein